MQPTESQIEEIKSKVTPALLKQPGVHGVGIGIKVKGGKRSDKLAIIVSVDKKLKPEELEKHLCIPKEYQGVPTDVIESERFSLLTDQKFRVDAEQKTNKKMPEANDIASYRPLRGGCQVDPHDGSWGSLGIVVFDQNSNPGILTCNHVMKTNILRQGTEAVVANVTTRAVENDCAYAQLVYNGPNPIDWYNWIIDIGPIQGTYTVTVADAGKTAVRKRGAMTLLSHGKISQVGYTGIDADGNDMPRAFLVNGDKGGSFSSYGDSGSAVVDDQNQILGMVQSGNNAGITACIYIDDVVAALNITIPTEHMPPLFVVHEGKGAGNRGDGWVWGASAEPSLTQINPDHLWPTSSNNYGTYTAPRIYTFRGVNPTSNNSEERQILVHQDGSGRDWLFCGSSDGTTWTADGACPNNENAYNIFGPPNGIIYRGVFYMFWALQDGADATKQWMWMGTNDTKAWTNKSLVPPNSNDSVGTTDAPGLCVYKGKLYIVHQGQNADSNLWLTTMDENGFSSDQIIVTKGGGYSRTSGTPALATFKGKMYMFHEDSGDNGNIKYNIFDGATWTDDALVSGNLKTSGPPALFVYNGKLICLREGGGNSGVIWYSETTDGTTWTDKQLKTPAGTPFGIHGTPSAAIFPVNAT